MKRRVRLAALVFLTACESDAHKLERLQFEEYTACLPVLRSDSLQDARDAASKRADQAKQGFSPYTRDSSSLALLQADQDELNRFLDEEKAQLKLLQTDPVKYHADQKAAAAQRTHCELARRALGVFMNGR